MAVEPLEPAAIVNFELLDRLRPKLGKVAASSVDAAELSRPIELACLAKALEASWDHLTAYQGAVQHNNLAYGQCYPTSRVVQWFYPEVEIARGDVWIGRSVERHFWNIRGSGDDAEWIDLSWTQFPPGSIVQRYRVLDRGSLGDSRATVERCALLLRRVLAQLAPEVTARGRK